MNILDDQFKARSEWFAEISEEVEYLLISRETLKQLAEFFEANTSSYDAVALNWYMKWNGSTWGVATAARLRALGDPDPGTKSLRSLLDKVRRHPEVFTRQRYVALTGAGDPYSTERANREFTEHFGSGDAIDPARAEADVLALDAAMLDVKNFVDKRVAHLDPKWATFRLQYGPFYRALDVLRDLTEKYHLLFKGEHQSGKFGRLLQFRIEQVLRPEGKRDGPSD